MRRPHTTWGLCVVVATITLGAGGVPDRGNSISRALFAAGRLWLLTDVGDLSSISPGGVVRAGSGLSEQVLDACVTGGELEVLTCEGLCGEWRLRTWRSGRWFAGMVVPSQGDAVVALNCHPGGETVVTDRRLIDIIDATAVSVPLSEEIAAGAVTSVHVTTDHVFIGVNAGEWGGGLRRVDRKTGKVNVIERNATGTLCGGPLDTACDPVNGIADEPWRPSCVAVAVGLVHFSPSGRLVEVCQDDVRSLYFKAYGDPGARAEQGQSDEPRDTVAFFGLVRAGEQLLAAGIDGVYRFDGSSPPTIIQLPKFEDFDGVGVSFELPDVALVLTTINQRQSIGGAVPLLVPR